MKAGRASWCDDAGMPTPPLATPRFGASLKDETSTTGAGTEPGTVVVAFPFIP